MSNALELSIENYMIIEEALEKSSKDLKISEFSLDKFDIYWNHILNKYQDCLNKYKEKTQKQSRVLLELHDKVKSLEMQNRELKDQLGKKKSSTKLDPKNIKRSRSVSPYNLRERKEINYK